MSRVDVDYGSGAIYDGARLYDAYGKELWATPGSSDEEVSYVPFRWKGQAGYVSDYQTGLVYCWHRYYDPRIGRWISPDPIGLEGGVNTYAYCSGDPVQYMDPSGLRALTDHEWAMLSNLISYASNHEIPGYSHEEGLTSVRYAAREIYDLIRAIPDGKEDPESVGALMKALEVLGTKRFGEYNSEERVRGLKIAKGKPKCNQFIYYCYDSLPMHDGDYWSALALASDSVNLKGFQNGKIRLGSIVAFGTSRYSKKNEGGKSLGHGHATIYVGAGMLIYASDYGVKLGRVKEVQGNRLMGVRNAN